VDPLLGLRDLAAEALDAAENLLAGAAQLVADLAEKGLARCREMIESECKRAWLKGEKRCWYDSTLAINGIGGYNVVDDTDDLNDAIALLDRAGVIERKADAPHLIRFVEE